MAEKNDFDWLFPNAEKQATQQREKGLLIAQKYLVFRQDARAKDLLEMWTSTVRRNPIAKGASVQEYAAVNALREFVEGIHAQIEFAENGLNQPKQRAA